AAPSDGGLRLQADAHCTLAPDPKVKAPLRHVLIPDLAKVAAALKLVIPLQSPSALFMAFDGEPSAAEHCAKGLHAKLLKRLAKGCKSDAELSRALGGSLLDLD
ncbi:unnamed protein product, partial [Polarella glacialis]